MASAVLLSALDGRSGTPLTRAWSSGDSPFPHAGPADNLTSHEEELAGFREKALGDPRLSGLVVSIGRGELVAVKLA